MKEQYIPRNQINPFDNIQYKNRYWNISVEVITAPKNITVLRGCNSFQVTNTGNTTVTVNGAILYPGVPGTSIGDSRTFGGNSNEIYKGNIQVYFGAGANPQCEIIQKFYIDVEQ